MTQEVDPLHTLIEDDIKIEMRRIKALAVTGDSLVLRNELAATLLQLVQDVARQLYGRVMQTYGVLGEHAQQLDDIEKDIDAINDEISGGVTTIQPEDAEKIMNLVDAFVLLASEFVEGRVPTVGDASVRAALQEQIANANAVRAIVAESVAVPEDDDESDDDDEGTEEQPS